MRDSTLDDFAGSASADGDAGGDGDGGDRAERGGSAGTDEGDERPLHAEEPDEAAGEEPTAGTSSDTEESDEAGAHDAETDTPRADTPRADTGGTRSTYAWDPAGTCADCGAEAARRWRVESGFVCGACKEW